MKNLGNYYIGGEEYYIFSDSYYCKLRLVFLDFYDNDSVFYQGSHLDCLKKIKMIVEQNYDLNLQGGY